MSEPAVVAPPSRELLASPYLRVAEGAAYAAVPVGTFRDWVKRRLVAHVVIPGGRRKLILIERASLEQFLSEHRVPARGDASRITP